VAFVTFNVVGSHIGIYSMNISSICFAIYSLMSKFSTNKTMTIQKIYIPQSEWYSLWCSPF
jgi:hypothetical protein